MIDIYDPGTGVEAYVRGLPPDARKRLAETAPDGYACGVTAACPGCLRWRRPHDVALLVPRRSAESQFGCRWCYRLWIAAWQAEHIWPLGHPVAPLDDLRLRVLLAPPDVRSGVSSPGPRAPAGRVGDGGPWTSSPPTRELRAPVALRRPRATVGTRAPGAAPSTDGDPPGRHEDPYTHEEAPR